MSEKWRYDRKSNIGIICSIYCTNITYSTQREFKWSVVLNDGIMIDLFDIDTQNPNFHTIDRKALNNAKTNALSLDLHEHDELLTPIIYKTKYSRMEMLKKYFIRLCT